MKLELWALGQTKDAWLRDGLAPYPRRIARLTPFAYVELPGPRLRGAARTQPEQVRVAEAAYVAERLHPADRLILLDEGGRRLSSRGLAEHLESLQRGGGSRLVILVGGAFGFGDSLRERAEGSVRLSDLTLTHQMARLLALEQVYRAYSILRGLPYHND